MDSKKGFIACLALAAAGVTSAWAEPTLEWIRQSGSPSYDEARDVSTDGLGNVYISGFTGFSWDHSRDVSLTKYDASGRLRWTRQFGTSELDIGLRVAADGLGNVYISG